jgi:hypothetical protein
VAILDASVESQISVKDIGLKIFMALRANSKHARKMIIHLAPRIEDLSKPFSPEVPMHPMELQVDLYAGSYRIFEVFFRQGPCPDKNFATRPRAI